MREKWLDNAKALAIILVVFGHCLTSVEGYSFFVRTDLFIYGFHMPLFFALSGFSFALIISKYKKNNDLIYYLRHLLKIAILYICFSGLYIVLNLLLRDIVHVHTDMEWSFLYLMLVKPIAHYWFLYILFFLYVLGFFMAKLFDGNKALKYIVMAVILGLAFASPLLKELKIWEMERLCKHLFFFELGYLFNEWKEKLTNCRIVFLILSLFSLIYSYIFNGQNLYLYIAIAVFITIFIFLYSNKYFNRNIAGLSYTGQYCLWIFLFHSYFTSITSTICEKLFPGLVVIRVLTAFFAGITGPLVMSLIFNSIKKRINK